MSISTPLLKTKLYAPSTRPHLIPRQRLVELLDRGLAHPFTLISAPAGFGKTTLLSEWIHSFGVEILDGAPASGATKTPRSNAQKPAFCWISLDEDDNDPRRFLLYLVAAWRQAQPGVGETALAMLRLPQLPSIYTTLTTLINDSASQSSSLPVVLILDDYHLITAPALHEAIVFLVEHLPPQVHLLMATRVDPPLPLMRWRMRAQMVELRADDLRFVGEEATAFLSQVMGLNLSVEEIAVLEERTEGWIAGLQLAALSLQGRPDAGEFIQAFGGSHHYILDFLAEEVLQRQPQSVQQFLLQTAILDRFCGQLCDAVTGRNDSQMMLEQMQRANLFLVPLDDERRWHRYHHLFAAFLRSRLQHLYPELQAKLHERASRWYEENQLLSEAIDHTLATPDVERAMDLLERAGKSWLVRGEAVMLLGRLQQLPTSLLYTRPKLCLFAIKASILQHRLDESERWLRAIEGGSQDDRVQPHDAALLAEAMVIRANLALNRDDPLATVELAQHALNKIPPEQKQLRGEALLYLGIAYQWQGNYPAAEQAYQAGSRYSTGAGDVLIAMHTRVNQARLLYWQGQLHRGINVLRDAFAWAEQHNMQHSPLMATYHATIGEFLYEENQLERAAQHLAQGIQYAQDTQNIRNLLRGYALSLRLAMAQNNKEKIRAIIDAAQRLIQQHTLTLVAIGEFERSLARYWLYVGDITAVAAWTATHPFSPDAPIKVGQEYRANIQARLMLARGEAQAALDFLAQIQPWIEQMGNRQACLEASLLGVLALNSTGKRSHARQILGQLLALAEPAGFIRTFIDEGEPLRLLVADCYKTIKDPHLAAYANRLLAAFGQAQGGAPETSIFPPSISAAQRQVSAGSNKLVEPLTGREREILHLAAAGLSNQMIATQLFVSVGAVKKHLNNIFGKLQAKNRVHLVVRARELGLLE